MAGIGRAQGALQWPAGLVAAAPCGSARGSRRAADALGRATGLRGASRCIAVLFMRSLLRCVHRASRPQKQNGPGQWLQPGPRAGTCRVYRVHVSRARTAAPARTPPPMRPPAFCTPEPNASRVISVLVASYCGVSRERFGWQSARPTALGRMINMNLSCAREIYREQAIPRAFVARRPQRKAAERWPDLALPFQRCDCACGAPPQVALRRPCGRATARGAGEGGGASTSPSSSSSRARARSGWRR